MKVLSFLTFNPSVDYVGNKERVKLNGDCLKQEEFSLDYGKIVNIYFVYVIGRNVNISSYPRLENCFFGAVKLAKYVDVNLHNCSGYGTRFGR